MDAERKGLRAEAAHTWQFCPPGEPIPGKSYHEDGWFYFDPPGKFSVEVWDQMTSIIGTENDHYIILITSSGHGLAGKWKRGQMLVSPEGMANMRKYALAAGAASDAEAGRG